MESQKETSVSLEEIEASSQELMQLAEDTKKTTGRKTSFKRQADALARKHASFYKRSWTTLVIQLIIPLVFMLCLFAISGADEFKFGDDPHPLVLPPQVPYQPGDPVRFTIPYVDSSSSLGSCCQTDSGFLGLISFDVLNSSTRPANAGFPYTLGDYSTSDYSFEKYDTNDDMFSMLYDTTKTGWVIAYLFESMDFDNNRFHIGYMKNISEYGARGSLAGVNLIDNALLAATTSPSHSLTIRLKQFPTWAHTLKISGSGAAGTWFLLGCSFFMVPILALIVREKQDRLRNLLVLAGMRMVSYWVVLFCIGLLAYFFLMLFWLGLGYALQQVAFTHVATGSLILLFFVYAFTQVGFAFFTSTFVDEEPTAALGGYTWILFFVILTQSIVAIIVDLGSDTEMYGVSVLPPFAVTVVVNAMSTYYYPSGGSMSMSEFYDDRASMALLILFLVGVGFFLVHAYLDQVYPAKYGIRKHPLFFLPKYSKAKAPEVRVPQWCPKKVFSENHAKIDVYADPEDVALMRNFAVDEYKTAKHDGSPLIIPGISKSFASSGLIKVAVDDLPLLVSHLECFGLLGPNGGGKTTLVNILSGLYPTTAGDAKIKGHSVVEELAKAQRHMGVCPQDCVLWKELSAREHLLLFGRLRNLRGQQLHTAVNLVLKQVLLTDAADRPCGGYSGGMKRRLSLAISLIGCPPVVLLDEPTTGVDPFSRHVVWDTIRAYKHYCTIILITHNMEEADALCERVGMISEGRMACVGRPSELKVRYNVGYSLTILHSAVSPDNIIALVESIVRGAQLLDTLPGSCLFTLPKANTKLSLLFSAFKEQSESLHITDWALLPSNLEDVLIKSTHKEM